MAEIIFNDVTFTYSGTKKPAIENINLKISKGEIILVTGPAGAGKSTLCYCMNGLIPHFFKGELKGEIYVGGKNVAETPIAHLARMSGLVFQNPSQQLVSPTVEDEMAFGPENFGIPVEEIKKRVEHCLNFTRLTEFRNKNPYSLSGGQQQACAIGAVVAMNPEIYVFDEPTSNLDPLGSTIVFNTISKLVKEEKKTMVIVSHNIDKVAPIADRMIFMNDGKIIFEGKPQQVLENAIEMLQSGIKPPDVSLLIQLLKKRAFLTKLDFTPATIDEAIPILSKFISLIIRGKESKEAEEAVIKRKTNEPVIEVEDLWHIYPDGTVALSGIDLEIYRGEFIAIIGQNGSGKTTLVKHFNGLLKPSKGCVKVFGKDTRYMSISELAKSVGYCFQNPDNQIFSRTVWEEIAFGPKNLGLPPKEVERRVNEILKLFGLENVAREDPYSLSLGQRHQVAFASIAAMKPEILIVDEPTTGQDYKMGRLMMDFAKKFHQEGKTVIVITHDMDIVARYAERCIVLNYGRKILDEPPRKLFSKVEVLQEAYLEPPQITQLGLKLNLPKIFLTVEEMYEFLMSQLKQGEEKND